MSANIASASSWMSFGLWGHFFPEFWNGEGWCILHVCLHHVCVHTSVTVCVCLLYERVSSWHVLNLVQMYCLMKYWRVRLEDTILVSPVVFLSRNKNMFANCLHSCIHHISVLGRTWKFSETSWKSLFSMPAVCWQTVFEQFLIHLFLFFIIASLQGLSVAVLKCFKEFVSGAFELRYGVFILFFYIVLIKTYCLFASKGSIVCKPPDRTGMP